MSRLHTIGSIIIRVNGLDHPPPHFHVHVGEDSAVVEIATFTVRESDLRPNDLRVAMDWVRENIEIVRAEWNRLHPRIPC